MLKTKTKNRLTSLITFTTLAVFAVITLAPFYFMLVSSFKPGGEIVRNGINIKLQPEIMSLRNYKILFTESTGIFLHWYKNSLIITFLQTTSSVFLSALVGYGLAIYRFKGRNLLFVLVLVLMMVPIEILMLPLYKLFVSFKLIDRYAGVILPYIVSPVAVFFFRQFAL